MEVKDHAVRLQWNRLAQLAETAHAAALAGAEHLWNLDDICDGCTKLVTCTQPREKIASATMYEMPACVMWQLAWMAECQVCEEPHSAPDMTACDACERICCPDCIAINDDGNDQCSTCTDEYHRDNPGTREEA